MPAGPPEDRQPGRRLPREPGPARRGHRSRAAADLAPGGLGQRRSSTRARRRAARSRRRPCRRAGAAWPCWWCRRRAAGTDHAQTRPRSSPLADARPLESRPLAQIGANASTSDETLRLRGDPSPDDRLLADTRESQIAAYLDGWKRRVEQIGTIHFPNEARRCLSGNPVLEVAVRADGSLQQVIVRRSSGHRELDAAAMGIVRLAAPFDPFPPRCATATRCCASPTSGSSRPAGPAPALSWMPSP